ncbi:MAG: organic solvent tolerance protein [Bdellovibrionales bacterium]
MRTWIIVLLCVFGSSLAQAKDLTSRLGIGFSQQYNLDEDLPSLAMRYFPSGDYGLAGALGVDTTKNNSRFGAQIKIIKLVYPEDHMNFYTGAGAGLVSREDSGSTDSGFDLTGFVGTEFFLSGLENLSFCFEAGIGVTSISNEVRFRTVADHPFKAGLYFYF